MTTTQRIAAVTGGASGIGLAIAEKPEGPWKRFDRPIVDITDD